MTNQINVSVDPDVADAYLSASDSERKRLDLLVNLRLREATSSSDSLEKIVREISQNAQQRGLTPEILKSLIND